MNDNYSVLQTTALIVIAGAQLAQTIYYFLFYPCQMEDFEDKSNFRDFIRQQETVDTAAIEAVDKNSGFYRRAYSAGYYAGKRELKQKRYRRTNQEMTEDNQEQD